MAALIRQLYEKFSHVVTDYLPILRLSLTFKMLGSRYLQ
jgi:hypothetical protein